MLLDSGPEMDWCYEISFKTKGKPDRINKRSAFKLKLRLSGPILQSVLSASAKWTMTFQHGWRVESAQLQCLLHMRGTDNEPFGGYEATQVRVIWEVWFHLRDGHSASAQTGTIDLISNSNLQALSGTPHPAAVIPLAPVGTHKPTRSGC